MNISRTNFNQLGLTKFQSRALSFGTEEKQEKQVDKIETLNDTAEISQIEKPKKSNTGKKWGVGIASVLITGLGQVINGEVGKGIGLFAGAIASTIIILKVRKVNPTASAVLNVAALGIPIYSVVDAVKGVDRKAAKDAAK